MSEGIIIALISSATAVVVVYVKHRFDRTDKHIDGRLTELLDLTRKSSEAKGNKEGREELKEENKTHG